VVVSDFPEIFAEFRGKRFQNLWRGSRDGLSASQFHGRCDGHANSQKSFLFTLKNLHNVAPREAIICNAGLDSPFSDIRVRDGGNTTHNLTYAFDPASADSTVLDMFTVFTTSKEFQVKKIELFEITD
jgi:hypothetical protein